MSQLPSKGKILALDIGSVRTGIALSDQGQIIAFPRKEMEHGNDEDFMNQLSEFIENESVEGILIGVPIALGGEESQQTTDTLEKVEHIKQKFGIPVETMDERFTTIQAKSLEEGVEFVDSKSAGILLETYFASNATNPGSDLP